MFSRQTPAAASRRLLEQIRGSGEATPVREEPPAPQADMNAGIGALFRRWKAAMLMPRQRDGQVIGVAAVEGGYMVSCCTQGKKPRLLGMYFCPLAKAVAPESAKGLCHLREFLQRTLPEFATSPLWTVMPPLAGETYFLRLPKVKDAELDGVAMLAARKEKTFELAQTVFDYRVIEEVMDNGVPRLSVAALAAPKAQVAEIAHMWQQAGLRLTGLVAQQMPLFSLYASSWLSTPWECFALVEIAAELTHIIIFHRQTILLRRVVRTGQNAMMEALAELVTAKKPESIFSVPQEAVYQIDSAPNVSLMDALTWGDQAQHTAPPAGESAGKDADLAAYDPADMAEFAQLLGKGPEDEQDNLLLHRALPPVLRRLARQVERTLEFCVNSGEISAVQGVVVAGPAGCADFTMSSFREETGLPCVPLLLDGDAGQDGARELTALLRTHPIPQVLHSIGLALSGAVTPNALLTNEGRRRARRHLLYARGCIAAGMCLSLGMCAVAGQCVWEWRAAARQADLLDARIQAWPERFNAEMLQKEMEKLRALHAKGKNLLHRRLPAALIGELADITPESIHITDVNYQLAPPEKAERRSRNNEGRKDAAQGGPVAVIKGIAYGSILERESRLAEFLTQLEHSLMVRSITLEKEPASGDGVVFVVTCRLV